MLDFSVELVPDEKELRVEECGKTKDQEEDNKWMEVCNKKGTTQRKRRGMKGGIKTVRSTKRKRRKENCIPKNSTRWAAFRL